MKLFTGESEVSALPAGCSSWGDAGTSLDGKIMCSESIVYIIPS